ncbi:Pimeloyl-ACP methyl ester carboxylesterase [Paenibacillus algorifonticola]|uniref:Pimeloyl-ACP methyl ester carboxylesterase n=1 Tax=Paenibacillus algorifonticola TaxID=684063 RepID=A0A1I2A869_9BACL|nr:alpha/beta hydrolase [Paenibacillus algorifonticola]SFE40284.1 Pimeloyl-ACP methyl ester carboxylesterase [Paenibacillus algorifonticola]
MNEFIVTARHLPYRNSSIFYQFMPNPGKQTLLFLHPAFADHRVFCGQTSYFKTGYQVIALDMPGHGRSQVHGTKVTLKDMPHIVAGILDKHNIAACHVVGVSLGSLAAQSFAERYNERVHSVTIVGGYSIHRENTEIWKEQKREGLRWLFYFLFSMGRFRRYVTTFSCSSSYGRNVFAQSAKLFNRRSFAAMAGLGAFFTKKDTSVPYNMLLVYGEKDLKVLVDNAHNWQKTEALSQLFLLPGAGHCAQLDAPESFNHILERFIVSVSCRA